LLGAQEAVENPVDAEQDVAEVEAVPEPEEGEQQHPAKVDGDANASLSPFADDDVQVTDAVQEDEAEEMVAVLPDRPPTREVRRGSPQTSPGVAPGEEGAAEVLPGRPDEEVPPISMPTAAVHSPTHHTRPVRCSTGALVTEAVWLVSSLRLHTARYFSRRLTRALRLPTLSKHKAEKP
jgi:hypothetical protein